LLEDSLIPLLDYAESREWPYPYAPHDLGTYPLDNARPPSRMESMPVEESGNMLLMVAAIAKAEGNASFAGKYWPLLTRWAGYLKTHGLDPGNQLCTDDFTGVLAHNANLSLKAIEALGGYALLGQMLDKQPEATAYRRIAEDYARRWIKMANDGNHTRLAFDRPGTWSQKYNLVWDRVLGLNLFPPQLAQSEVAWYQKQETHFGFPLDSRMAYTKLDWESWSAALAQSDGTFRSMFSGLYNFAGETPDRVPLSDWYWTIDGTQTGFQARPVVGALYMRMLTHASLWKKWANGQE
ncbi:MAG: glutaminase domain-containing protein, partial [Terriglobia bacterium]